MLTCILSRRRTLAALGFTALLPAAAAAHHGWSGYGTDDFSLTGTVEGATLGNPHGVVKVRAADGVWDVVLGPPSNQRRAGLTEDLVPAGAAVTAYGHRHLDPGRREMKTERLVVAGRSFDIYPDRL
ncbi:DUF6152 family protein [Methylobacterium isbiliense]|jgi:hypothetical protein|uniref:DUF5666 domain-containing protein n=1 Tax=Methylobacterium isbiliense TaxID=315478 RepID=A0ABQ4SES5_9HYPH|nr:DUF6152 family protein [Methylobacterium isbiliense]MDN3622393.1 DUF6152 family protein [Methylobacterium isbiliense]GJE01577.1 hypothetical protein GMJLKIPL_3511 [Methylobacterium isbiliense]